eukprot:Gb_03921 [translate_table: standard]
MNHSVRSTGGQGHQILEWDESSIGTLQTPRQFEDSRPQGGQRYPHGMLFSQQYFATRSHGSDPKPQRMIMSSNSNFIHDYPPGFNLSSNFFQNQPECLNTLGIRNNGEDDIVPASSSLLNNHYYSGAGMYPYGLMQSNSDSARLPGLHGLTLVNNYSCRGSLQEVDDEDAQAGIGLNLGGRTYFAATQDHTSDVNRYFYRRPRAMSSAASQIPRCQAEGCRANLSTAKHYHRRHKVCELHSKASSVIAGGVVQRFCQQCSRFHVISEFDEGKRSCRKRLADHNRRRRKPRPDSFSTAAQTRTIKDEEDLDSNPMSHATGWYSILEKGVKQRLEDESGQRHPVLITWSSHCDSGLQPTVPITRTLGTQPNLLTAIPLSPSAPPVLQNTKKQLHVLPASSEKVYCPQYLGDNKQTSPNLTLSSVGKGFQNQSQSIGYQQTCLGNVQIQFDLKPSQLQTSGPCFGSPKSECTGSLHSRRMVDYDQSALISEKNCDSDSNLKGATSCEGSSKLHLFSSSHQNRQPLQSSRELGIGSYVGVNRFFEQMHCGLSDINLQSYLQVQQMPSFIKANAGMRNVTTEDAAQQSQTEEEYFSQHQGSLTSSTDSLDHYSENVNQPDTKFSEMQFLRPLGQSIYETSQNIV